MGVNFTYPGVYVQELSSGVHTITGVATSIAAFIGWAPQGSVTSATLVESWADFQRQFGGLTANVPLGYAVYQFFGNGGQQAYIVRLVGADALTASANSVGGAFTLYASSPGAWANNLQIRVTAQSSNASRYAIQVLDATTGAVLETFANLSSTPTDPQYVVTVIDNDSHYLTFQNPKAAAGSVITVGVPGVIPAPTMAAPTSASTGGNLAGGATYYYQVSALYGGLESQPSSEQHVAISGATNTNANTISWTAAAAFNNQPVTGYKIYRGTASGAENLFYTAAAGATSFLDTGAASTAGSPSPSATSTVAAAPQQVSATSAPSGLAAGAYFYVVTAVYGASESKLSGEASATSSQNGAIVISWAAAAPSVNNTNLSGYNVYKGVTSGKENSVASVGAKSLSLVDTGAASLFTSATLPTPASTAPAAPASVTGQAIQGTLPAATYYYQVSALYGAVESLPSAEQPVSASGSASVNFISWSAPSPLLNNQNPTGYKIYRGTAAGAENVFYVVGNRLSFIDTGSANAQQGSPSPSNAALQLSGGQDGGVLQPATDGNFENALNATGSGLSLLDRVPIFNLLCAPGETDGATIQSLQAYCYRNKAFLIVDAPQSADHQKLNFSGPQGTAIGGGQPGPITMGPNAGNSAYYFPWISAPDPLAANRPKLFPPCGFIAGIYAATDAAVGVWKSPAGIDAGLSGVLGLQYNLTDVENGDLNTQGINCLREFRTYGDVVWGARTLLGANEIASEWKYICVRRMALFLEKSLYEGLQWVVFEPNDEPLWAQIRLNVGAFMQTLFRKGAFQGATPQKAYFVKCDSETTTPTDQNNGVVNILVGFAPLKPAEFVVVQIQQIAGQTGQ